MKKILTSIVVIIAFGLNANAEKKSNRELRGDKYYFVYSFDKAIDSYTKAKELTLEGHRRLAKSYCNMNKPIESEAAYSKLISLTGGNMADDYFCYIMVLKKNGKYDQANVWMDKFGKEHPADLRVKNYKANKWDLANMLKDNGKYKVQHLDLNSTAEDFGTSYYKDKVVFASSRTASAKKYSWNGMSFLDIYVSEMEGIQLKAPSVFDKSLDGRMHDGPASFSKDGTYMAFTRNNYDLKRKDKIVRVEICFSTYKDEKWSKPEAYALNNKEYSVGHPCLSANGNTMYFTSDMPGGYGGVDIYRTSKDKSGVWATPENVGNRINTEGDELYPFFEEKNSQLYFASNGLFGQGGLDIFVSKMDASEFGPAYNAGTPLNSPYDDFAFITDEKTSKGYFSSNRTGGSGDDDIYGVEILNGLDVGKKVVGIAHDKKGKPLPNTFVTLLDANGIVLDSMFSKMDGGYVFYVDADKKYELMGKKEKYFDADTTFGSFAKEYVIVANLMLPIVSEVKGTTVVQQIKDATEAKTITKKIKVGADLGKIANLNSIYYDFDKSNIRQDAQAELIKIVKIVNANPKMHIEMGSYTDCRASEKYNQALSNRRATASIKYIKKRVTNPDRVSGKGYGETNLVNTCACEDNIISDCSEVEFQKDRRTEFIIVKK